MKQNWLVLFLLFCALLAGAYYLSQPDFSRHKDNLPSTLHVGVLPDEKWEQLSQRYEPLLVYLAEKTGITVKLVQTTSYDHLLEQFQRREVDLANFGGLTFVLAMIHNNAQALVMRDIDMAFSSLFFVRGKDGAQGVSDTRGKNLCFGSRKSTSGHLMPRYYLLTQLKINPEEFFADVCYSGGHDETAYRVRDGVADIGVANATIIQSMIEDGRLQSDDIRIIWQTPPYPDYVWATQDNLPPGLTIKLRNAFLGLTHDDPVGSKILENMGAGYYLPARLNDFQPLREIAETIGLIQR